MPNHKRKRPKHQRNGCLLCKPHKDERSKGSLSNEKMANRKVLQEDIDKAKESYGESPNEYNFWVEEDDGLHESPEDHENYTEYIFKIWDS